MSSSGQRIAVLACMDARLDAAGYLDGLPEPVHIVRNAGGRATVDALRSLAVSCTTGIDRILVFHHTKCAMAAHSEEELRELLPDGAEPEMELLTIADPEEALREDLATLRGSPLLPADVEASGCIYDLDTGKAREIEADSPAVFERIRLDHVQIAAPPGCEADARRFFGDLIGLPEIEKPEPLRKRGGVWFAVGDRQLHIGVEAEFTAARKAHPALSLPASDLDLIASRLADSGVDVVWDSSLPGQRRFYCQDPWGNRIELMGPDDSPRAPASPTSAP